MLGGSAATALLEGDTSITGVPSTDALAVIALERALEAALFLSDVTGGERTEYPAETDTLPLGTESPATPIDRPGRYDTPIVEQEGWSSELPIAEPAYGDHTSAVRTETLNDGRIIYYGAETPARTSGPTRGASLVTEYQPETGNMWRYYESYNHDSLANRVHPKMIDEKIVRSQHYPPTKNEPEGNEGYGYRYIDV